MKNYTMALALCILTVFTTVLMTGCVIAPPGRAVVVETTVPDYYCWDGYEYVGWVGDRYYYLGPGHVWLVCDPVRLHRFNGWVGVHPHWRAHATVNVQFRVDAAGRTHPLRRNSARRGYARDHDRY